MRSLRRVHTIATAIVGAQLLIWVLTGLGFTCFDFDDVGGKADRAAAEALDPRDVELSLSDAVAAAHAERGVASATVRVIAGRAAYVIERLDGDAVLVDAKDGKVFTLSEGDARAIAVHAFKGGAEVRAIDRLSDEREASGMALPAYRVRLGDARATEVFVDARTGEIASWRNVWWRRFDFLWTLHVMGYVSRKNPAQWPLRIVAALASAVALSGVGLLALKLRGYARGRERRRERLGNRI